MDSEYAQRYRHLYQNHWWWRAREDFLISILRSLPLEPRARILDVGCGDGLLLDRLDDFGIASGLEINEHIVALRNEDSHRIFISPFDRSFQPEERFSLILMLDVVEHFDDPLGALATAVDLLEPHGHLVVTIPAFRCLWTAHDDLNRHHDRYTARRFVDLAQRAGVRVDRTEYFFHWLFFVKLGFHLKEKLVQTEPAVPRVPPRPLNRLLHLISRLEIKFLRPLRLGFGNSLLVVGGREEGQ
jgi:SAM-dependent methyltransferase